MKYINYNFMLHSASSNQNDIISILGALRDTFYKI